MLKLTEKMRAVLPSKFYAWLYRVGLNFWPCYRGSGGRVVHISPDFRELIVRLKFNLRTRNLVGTIFGGSLYASTDPIYMIMLMENLGPDFVVWDKAASVRFRRPAKTTLFAKFEITPTMLTEVRDAVAKNGEHTFTWTVQFKDKAGTLFTELDKVLYVATKSHYKEKQRRRSAEAHQV